MMRKKQKQLQQRLAAVILTTKGVDMTADDTTTRELIFLFISILSIKSSPGLRSALRATASRF